MSSSPFCARGPFRLAGNSGACITQSHIGIDPLLAKSGTYMRNLTTLEQLWDAPGFLLAFEARLAYLEEIPATEVSDGSTCTQGTIPGNRAGSSRHPHMAKRPPPERLRNLRHGTRLGCQQ